MSARRHHEPGQGLSLRLGTLELEGFSISGLSTWIRVPAFDACFDLGHCTVSAQILPEELRGRVHFLV